MTRSKMRAVKKKHRKAKERRMRKVAEQLSKKKSSKK